MKGVVRDSLSGESIIGANVFVEGAGLGTATDIDGSYLITGINVGTYTVVVSFISYKTIRLENIVIENGKTTTLDIKLPEDVATLGEIIVVGERETYTDVSVISEIKLSQQVVTGVSAEQMAKNQDKDAAQAMSRIPGITITDGRFVNIRGISERYNNVLINNIIAPSTEVDIRSFSFDLIPSSSLDRMLVYKSASPEYPGDFAGGIIKLYTQNVVTENKLELSIGTGYRSGTTFGEHFQTKGGPTDFLGFDNQFRAIPPGTPENLMDVSSNVEKVAISRNFRNNFNPEKSMMSPDAKMGIKFAWRLYQDKKKLFSNITSFNYSNTGQYMKIERDRYDAPSSGAGNRLNPQFDFVDNQYNRNVRLGLIHNWMFRLNSNHRIEFMNMFNQLAEHETTLRSGIEYTSGGGGGKMRRNYGFLWMERSIYNGQLEGRHDFTEKTSVVWTVGYNWLRRILPDYRRFRTYFNEADSVFEAEVPATASNLFDMSRFYSTLVESSYAQSVSIEHKLKGFTEKDNIILKIGAYLEQRQRTFRARYLTYYLPSFNNIPDTTLSIIRSPLHELFGEQNLRTTRLILSENADPRNKYQGYNRLRAGYLGAVIPIYKFSVAAGARLEANRQRLQSSDGSTPIEVDRPITTLMPSVNVSYSFTDKTLVRAAYGRTVNRPEFRELAPFLFYDFNFDANFFGNEQLTIAVIDNYDIRFEFYPTAGEMITVGGFYKRFQNPIENLVTNVGFNQQFSYINARGASNYGAEIEIRKALDFVSDARLFRYLSIAANAAYIYSRVDLGDSVRVGGALRALGQDKQRALQGQSPYVINAGIYYNNEERGFNFNILYNVFGQRIFAVGNNTYPTIYELPRNVIDINISKTLGKKVEFKFGINDLLNAKYRFYQDTNRDGKILLQDDNPVIQFRRGTYYSSSLTYKF
ncbi:MAG: TonB-dependent receptor [Cytophagales bacterium]|nr:TonB-dependent receptor [Cytophagales bacterium]MDW8383837.1 TonB-dependent receptor [Flammeovirgaceae bacterium]